MKIIAMTCICADVFDATGEIRPGGEALNFAANLCRYPVDVALIGAVGEDDAGRACLRSIADRPIDVSGVRVVSGGKTASNRIYLTDAGDRYFKPDSWQSGVYGDFRIDELDERRILTSDAVYIHRWDPNLPRVLELRRQGHFHLAVDFDDTIDFDFFARMAPKVDFFFVSASEKHLPAFAALSQKADAVINVTMAERGSATFIRGEETRVAAVPVVEVIDTTGCGDSYHAGFLGALLTGADVREAMEEGSRVAARTLGHIGGF